MKNLLALFTCVFFIGFLSAQKLESKVKVIKNHEHVRIASMIDFVEQDGGFAKEKRGEVNPRRRPNAYGNDPKEQVETIRQDVTGYRNTITPIINISGTNQTSNPPDPTGAVGPNHYFQMINSSVQIWDKEGNNVFGPTSLGSFFPNAGNAGDPIVLYDEIAGRWFVSEFGNGNSLAVGVSETDDPLGAFNFYTFNFPQFPDYPKYNVWHDGYYVSGNFGNQETMIFDRQAMLNGEPTASSIILSLPQQASSGFRTALPVDHDGSIMPTRRAMIAGLNDNGWFQSQGADHVRIWNLVPDWVNETVGIEIEATLFTSPFDAIFPSSGGFCNIDQPGNDQSLDAIGDGLMHPATYRDFGSHESIVCCHSVDVDGLGTAGIRWYELRDEGLGWFIHQEGTYAPDDGENRWMGSIGIDQFGNISMGYSVSSLNTFPSLRFTGRYVSDPLGEMTIEECPIIDGTNSVSLGGCRWGDYAHMTMDPEDGITFWFTGEYGGSAHDTRIAAWQLGSLAPVDLGVNAINAPSSGSLSASEIVEVNVTNYGTEDQVNFSVSYEVNNGTPVTEIFTDTLHAQTAQSFAFATTSDMSSFGDYTIKAYTTILDDAFALNDTSETTITHFPPADVGVTAIVTPVSDQQLSTSETVIITVSNFGSDDQIDFPVTLEFDGGAGIQETISTNIPALGSADYTFNAGVNMEPIGDHIFKIYTQLPGDIDNTNDTLEATIETLEPFYCEGEADCASYGDAILRVRIEDPQGQDILNNPSGCGTNGYTDYTNIVTTLDLGEEYTFGVTEEFDDHWASMWIDLNEDFEFQESERLIDALSLPNANQEGATSLILPAGTPLGTFTMRVKSEWDPNNSVSTDACADIAYGETEDYTVIIEDIIDDVFELTESFSMNSFMNDDNNLVISVDGIIGDYDVKLLDARGRILKRGNFFNENGKEDYILHTQYLVSGTYFVLVYNKDTRITDKIVVIK